MTLSAQIVVHHLRLFGFPRASCDLSTTHAPLVLDAPGVSDIELVRRCMTANSPVVALRPDPAFLVAFGLASAEVDCEPPVIVSAAAGAGRAWYRLRSLHAAESFRSIAEDATLVPVVHAADGGVIWGWHAVADSGLLIVGTDLAGDVTRYRQGDPGVAGNRETAERWGFAGERPNYLFDAQLMGEQPYERHADWWCWTLRDALQRHAGLEALPVLPGNAPGAVVVTGDDDQAALACYKKQTDALGTLPVTYFLHPLTKHNRASLAALGRGRRVELGLHPDALDAPDRYGELLVEQAAWFQQLTTFKPRTVRNHGFLNDGYWGHLPHWRKAGIIASSNLPGVDGHVLNGSLLPARVAVEGGLSEHWSVLTAIGDGVIFVNDMENAAAGELVRENGHRVRESGVPGVLVLNLHPENIDRAIEMHVALRELVRDGFVAWTMSDMLEWFGARDGSEIATSDGGNSDGARAVMVEERQGVFAKLRCLLDRFGAPQRGAA